MLKAELERIEGDVCDISRRIREVEPEYFIVYFFIFLLEYTYLFKGLLLY